MLKRRDELLLTTKCSAINIWNEPYDPADATHGTHQPIKEVVRRASEKQGLGGYVHGTNLNLIDFIDKLVRMMIQSFDP